MKKNRLLKIIFTFAKTKIVYQLSRKLSGIFDSDITPSQAKEKMTTWVNDVINSELKCFDNFITTLIKYQEQITNYFIARNNSILEALIAYCLQPKKPSLNLSTHKQNTILALAA
jgi:transposase